MNFRSLSNDYELEILEDPLRRELLVVSTVAINNVSMPILAGDFGLMKCTNMHLNMHVRNIRDRSLS